MGFLFTFFPGSRSLRDEQSSIELNSGKSSRNPPSKSRSQSSEALPVAAARAKSRNPKILSLDIAQKGKNALKNRGPETVFCQIVHLQPLREDAAVTTQRLKGTSGGRKSQRHQLGFLERGELLQRHMLLRGSSAF